MWTSGRSRCFATRFVWERKVEAVAGRRVVEKEDEEEDGTRDVDEGVDAVGPVHERGMFEEPVLDGEFPEDMETLFEMDDLQGVTAGDVDCVLDHSHGGKGATELVDLFRLVSSLLLFN